MDMVQVPHTKNPYNENALKPRILYCNPSQTAYLAWMSTYVYMYIIYKNIYIYINIIWILYII